MMSIMMMRIMITTQIMVCLLHLQMAPALLSSLTNGRTANNNQLSKQKTGLTTVHQLRNGGKTLLKMSEMLDMETMNIGNNQQLNNNNTTEDMSNHTKLLPEDSNTKPVLMNGTVKFRSF